MFTPARLLIGLLVTYAVIFLAISTFSSQGVRDNDLDFTGSSLESERNDFYGLTEKKVSLSTKAQNKKGSTQKKKDTTALRMNPFAILGAYPDPATHIGKGMYDQFNFGLINDDDYCNQVDLYNLKNPQNMFKRKGFFTDFVNGTMVRKRVMSKIGTVYMQQIARNMPKKLKQSRTYPFDKRITLFHIQSDRFYKYHEVGKHFLCATQMFNHILNHTTLIRKDQVLQNIHDYGVMYEGRPECFDRKSFFPDTYRLFVKDECEAFFELLNSDAYKEAIEREPIQYLVKIGHGAHKAQGVFLVDRNETKNLKRDYADGAKCGTINKPLITQKYITNPMLLDQNNKFHLRVYVLIASTNPFIAYYHDGYLRASIFPFNPHSEDRATHLTNLLMSDQVGEALKNSTSGDAAKHLEGKTNKQLEDYYIWSFEELESYLIESGKTDDSNWLDNHLRPALQKAFVHVVRMVSGSFWKQSNVFEMYGCDFMLDDEMGVWFIEANPNPLLDGVQTKMIKKMLTDLYEIEYGYYRSRMKRVLDVIHKLQKETGNGPVKNLDKWKQKYQEAVSNRFEPEYQIKKTNSWKIIVDENLPGAEAYFGYIPEECVDR